MLSFSVVSAVAWSVVYSYGIWGAIELAILMIVRDYLLVGALIATTLWYESYNMWMTFRNSDHQVFLQPGSSLPSVTLNARRR